MHRLTLDKPTNVQLNGMPKQIQTISVDGTPVLILALADDDITYDAVIATEPRTRKRTPADAAKPSSRADRSTARPRGTPLPPTE